MEINKDLYRDIILSKIVIGFYYIMIINNVVKRLIGYDGNMILVGLLLLGSLYCLKYLYVITKRCGKVLLISFYIFSFLYFISYFIYNNPLNVISRYVQQTFVYIFVGSIAFGISNYKVLINYFKKNSYIFLIILSLILLKKSSFVYLMSHSYLMLIPTLTHISILIFEKKIRMIPLIIYELIIILMIGSRGPILVIGVYIISLVLLYQKNVKIKLLLIFFGLIVYTMVFVNGEYTYNMLNNLGISSRSLMLILTNKDYNSGRDLLYDIGNQMIQSRPFFGWGIAGDSQYMGYGYVHNIFLEFQIDFGKYFGFILFVLLNVLYVYVIKKTKCHPFFILIICLGYVPLFVSNSYLISFDFIISLFICFKVVNSSRKRIT